MRIERIRLREVGPFDDVTIELPPGKDPKLADVYLLTGENGTGKSTVLYALASVIAGGQKLCLGSDLVVSRWRSPNSQVEIYPEGQAPFVAIQASRRSIFAGPQHGISGLRSLSVRGGGFLDYFGPNQGTNHYAELVSWLSPKAVVDYPALDWAAFAYAGLRSLSDVHIRAVQEPTTNPFEKSLSFLETADTELLANWIVNQNYKRLLAKEAGDHGLADQLDQSIRTIERVIGGIVDDDTFGFDITPKDKDVRVRWRGSTVRLGVLPDGLKSIVSWIADLLMRLDRIPWQDNTPVLERSFLLLLDEIDIHLHPAWQRKVLPLVQKTFPNAQIIASTHSPFVAGSLADGRIITFGFEGGAAVVKDESEPQLGVSYSAVLRDIFGIRSEFDVDTEQQLQRFHAACKRLLAGDEAARADLDQIADELAHRSEELREIVALELGQLRRQLAQLAQRAAP